MPREIVTLTGLSKICGRSRARMTLLESKGRIPADYKDNHGCKYWTLNHAQAIAKAMKERDEAGKSGPGTSIQFKKLSRKKKDRTEE